MFSYILIPDVPCVPGCLILFSTILIAANVPILTAFVASGMYICSLVGLKNTEQQSPAAITSLSLVLIYSSTLIAPFGNISNCPLNISVFGLNPTHIITISASYSFLSVITLLTSPFTDSNFITFSLVAILIPFSVNVFSAISVKSLSKYLFNILSSASTRITSLPWSLNASTNSTPIYPAPTTTTFLASFAASIIALEWSKFFDNKILLLSIPSILGIIGHEPDVMINLSNVCSISTPVSRFFAMIFFPFISADSTLCLILVSTFNSFNLSGEQ